MAAELDLLAGFRPAWHEDGAIRARLTSSIDLGARPEQAGAAASAEAAIGAVRTWIERFERSGSTEQMVR